MRARRLRQATVDEAIVIFRSLSSNLNNSDNGWLTRGLFQSGLRDAGFHASNRSTRATLAQLVTADLVEEAVNIFRDRVYRVKSE